MGEELSMCNLPITIKTSTKVKLGIIVFVSVTALVTIPPVVYYKSDTERPTLPRDRSMDVMTDNCEWTISPQVRVGRDVTKHYQLELGLLTDQQEQKAVVASVATPLLIDKMAAALKQTKDEQETAPENPTIVIEPKKQESVFQEAQNPRKPKEKLRQTLKVGNTAITTADRVSFLEKNTKKMMRKVAGPGRMKSLLTTNLAQAMLNDAITKGEIDRMIRDTQVKSKGEEEPVDADSDIDVVTVTDDDDEEIQQVEVPTATYMDLKRKATALKVIVATMDADVTDMTLASPQKLPDIVPNPGEEELAAYLKERETGPPTGQKSPVELVPTGDASLQQRGMTATHGSTTSRREVQGKKPLTKGEQKMYPEEPESANQEEVECESTTKEGETQTVTQEKKEHELDYQEEDGYSMRYHTNVDYESEDARKDLDLDSSFETGEEDKTTESSDQESN